MVPLSNLPTKPPACWLLPGIDSMYAEDQQFDIELPQYRLLVIPPMNTCPLSTPVLEQLLIIPPSTTIPETAPTLMFPVILTFSMFRFLIVPPDMMLKRPTPISLGLLMVRFEMV